MGFLKREDILAARLRHEDVTVEEWGGVVRVWEVSAADRFQYETATEGASAEDRVETLVSLCAGDESGPFNPPLSLEELKATSPAALLRVFNVALRVNTLSAEAAEEERKN